MNKTFSEALELMNEQDCVFYNALFSCFSKANERLEEWKTLSARANAIEHQSNTQSETKNKRLIAYILSDADKCDVTGFTAEDFETYAKLTELKRRANQNETR